MPKFAFRLFAVKIFMVRRKKKKYGGKVVIALLFAVSIISCYAFINDNAWFLFRLQTLLASGHIDESNADGGVSLRELGCDYEELAYAKCLRRRTDEKIVRHKGYVVSFNRDYKIPNWVGYELTRTELYGNVPRSDDFAPDPMLEGEGAELADYKYSGYSRGHMAPAADMKCSKEVMTESFYLSNICPQVQELNSGDWNELENKVRGWAKRDSAIFVITGPVVGRKAKTIGENKVAVPDAFFKVILSPFAKKAEAIGFLMENRQLDRPLRDYAMTVDEIESIAGVDFFYALPDSVEDEVERAYDLKYWNLK